MTKIWRTIIPTDSDWDDKFEYISDPSRDIILRFKDEISTYEDLTSHSAYADCDHPHKSKGHLLFIFDRCEVFVKPDEKEKKLYFIECHDIGSI